MIFSCFKNIHVYFMFEIPCLKKHSICGCRKKITKCLTTKRCVFLFFINGFLIIMVKELSAVAGTCVLVGDKSYLGMGGEAYFVTFC